MKLVYERIFLNVNIEHKISGIEMKAKYPYENLSLENCKDEQWKDIPGLEGYFMISDHGRVKRLEYELPFKDGRIYIKESMIIKSTLVKSPNYFVGDKTFFLRVTLTLAGNVYNFSIGRLLYHRFVKPIDLSNKHLFVISKDGNGMNMRPSNLLLADMSERTKLVIKRNRHENILMRPEVREKATEQLRESVSSIISQYNMKGIRLRTFASVPEAAKTVGKSTSSISGVLRGRKVTAGGHAWRYGSEPHIDFETFLEKRKASNKIPNIKKLSQYNMEGNRIAVYRSINEASRITGVVATGMGKVMLGKASSAGGFFWKQGHGNEKIDLSSYRYGIGSGSESTRKKVRQYSRKEKFIALHESVTEAAKAVNVTAGCLVGALKGIYKSVGGFKWKYA